LRFLPPEFDLPLERLPLELLVAEDDLLELRPEDLTVDLLAGDFRDDERDGALYPDFPDLLEEDRVDLRTDLCFFGGDVFLFVGLFFTAGGFFELDPRFVPL
jgi:hypothetical protein